MNPFETYFSSLGEDISGYSHITFKWNQCDASANLIGALYDYVRECNSGDGLFFATAGEHTQGKNEIPHIHLNMVVPHFIKNENESRRRNKYLLGTWDLVVENLTCKVRALKDESKIPFVRQLENTLKYCWKEETPLPIPHRNATRHIFPEDVRLYLTQSAVSLFEQSKDDARKRERATAVAKTLQGQIKDIIKGQSFESYTEYKIFVCSAVYRPLDISEYPTSNHLRNELQNVAINIGLVPPHYFI